MTLTIEVSPELEIKLEAEARNNGVGKDEFVKIILEEKLNSVKRKRLPDTSRIIAVDLPVRDRSQEREWLAKNRDEYDGRYVALNGNKLIALGENFKEAAIKARELGCKDALIVFVEGSQRPLFISGGLW